MNLDRLILGSTLWYVISYVSQNIVNHVMIVPEKQDATMTEMLLEHMFLKQGLRFAPLVALVIVQLQWQQLLMQRFSQLNDMVLLILLKTSNFSLASMLYSSFSTSFSLQGFGDWLRQSLLLQNYSSENTTPYDWCVLDVDMFLICIVIYAIAVRLKRPPARVFKKLSLYGGIVNITLRVLNLALQSQWLDRFIHQNPIASLHFGSFIFFCSLSYFNQYDMRKTKLYNDMRAPPSMPANKQKLQILSFSFLALLVLLVIGSSYVQLRPGLVCLILSKLDYVFAEFLFIVILQLHVAMSNISARLRKQSLKSYSLIQPLVFVALSGDLIARIIRCLAQQTLIGPYHALLFVTIVVGITALQFLVGYVASTLFDWLFYSATRTIMFFFDTRKRRVIRQMIKGQLDRGEDPLE